MAEPKPEKKIKILTISDHPLSPSGVGTQTKYFIVELLKTGKFEFISLGGAMKHKNYEPQKTEEFGDDWIIYPIDGYGNAETIRSILRSTKPDILWFMTDPRFYGWLWEIENEIRSLVPMVYYHVWDNYPYPTFNKIWYESTDVVATISKLTSDIVKTVAPNVEEHYLPHATPGELFKPLSETDITQFRKQHFGIEDENHMLVFWNNRNARRKQSGSLIYWFDAFRKKLIKKHPEANATLLMHTAANDPNGQDLYAIINDLDLQNREVLISGEKIPPDALVKIYNAADCTINISDAEGFGLATFESMACGTPIMTTMTGGLQEQVTSLKDITQKKMLSRNKRNKGVTEYKHGIGLEPASKAIIGSQEVPFIYEDRVSEERVIDGLMMMYEFGASKRKEMGECARQHVLKNYNFDNFSSQWEKIILDTHKKHGSWGTRKNYKAWELIAV